MLSQIKGGSMICLTLKIKGQSYQVQISKKDFAKLIFNSTKN